METGNGSCPSAGEQPAVGDELDTRADPAVVCGRLLDSLDQVTRELAAVPVGELGDGMLDALLPRLQAPLQRLEGVRAQAAAVSQARVVSRRDGGASGPVIREHQRRLAEEQQLTPGEVQRQVAAGQAVTDHEGTGRAVQEGRIGPRHAARIAEVLAATPMEQRDDIERQLLEMAGRLDGLAFGRAARRLLASIRPQALARDERRKQLDRSVRTTDTEDGGFAFSGLLYGAAAEQAREALRAFRRPDAAEEVRTPAQRSADAFEQLCAAALRSGDAPTRHGERPHVMVVFSADQYAALGVEPERAYGVFSGSGQVASGTELRQLVDDCELFRVLLAADGTPIEVSSGVRTVPMGLWRALLVRDAGCVWPGCDAPAAWCDVAHGNRSHARAGRLRLDNALLLCRRHHRRFDNGPYRVRIDGDRVHILRITADADVPVGTPDRGPAYVTAGPVGAPSSAGAAGPVGAPSSAGAAGPVGAPCGTGAADPIRPPPAPPPRLFDP